MLNGWKSKRDLEFPKIVSEQLYRRKFGVRWVPKEHSNKKLEIPSCSTLVLQSGSSSPNDFYFFRYSKKLIWRTKFDFDGKVQLVSSTRWRNRSSVSMVSTHGFIDWRNSWPWTEISSKNNQPNYNRNIFLIFSFYSSGLYFFSRNQGVNRAGPPSYL